MMIKFYRHYLIYKYNVTFSLFSTRYKLTNDKKSFTLQGEFVLLDPF